MVNPPPCGGTRPLRGVVNPFTRSPLGAAQACGSGGDRETILKLRMSGLLGAMRSKTTLLIKAAFYYSLLATCYLLLATCYLLLATCYLLLATCYLLLATSYLLLATPYSLLLFIPLYELRHFCYLISR